MDQSDDYTDNDLPPPWLRLWFEVARNLVVVIVLVGFALMLCGLVLVKLADLRRSPLPKMPDYDYSLN